MQKARADRLKEYATSVSMQNKEKLVVKKSRSAPAPIIKERMNESKRAAVHLFKTMISLPSLFQASYMCFVLKYPGFDGFWRVFKSFGTC